jgi:hypothetical protein
MNSILAESKNLLVINEYEKVFLDFKNSNRKVYIGDFYGDPQAAVISNEESFCVMVGCGLIIYHLQEPFEEFAYKKSTSQWIELFRESGKEWWIESIEVIDNLNIMFTVEEVDTENGGRYKMNIDDLEPIKCT